MTELLLIAVAAGSGLGNKAHLADVVLEGLAAAFGEAADGQGVFAFEGLIMVTYLASCSLTRWLERLPCVRPHSTCKYKKSVSLTAQNTLAISGGIRAGRSEGMICGD